MRAPSRARPGARFHRAGEQVLCSLTFWPARPVLARVSPARQCPRRVAWYAPYALARPGVVFVPARSKTECSASYAFTPSPPGAGQHIRRSSGSWPGTGARDVTSASVHYASIGALFRLFWVGLSANAVYPHLQVLRSLMSWPGPSPAVVLKRR